MRVHPRQVRPTTRIISVSIDLYGLNSHVPVTKKSLGRHRLPVARAQLCAGHRRALSARWYLAAYWDVFVCGGHGLADMLVETTSKSNTRECPATCNVVPFSRVLAQIPKTDGLLRLQQRDLDLLSSFWWSQRPIRLAQWTSLI